MKELNRWLLVFAVPIVSLATCRSHEHRPTIDTTSGTMHHWIQAEELQRVMKTLGAGSTAHWPSTLPDDPETSADVLERNQAFKDGVNLANELSEAARRIPGSIAQFNLSQADRTSFNSTAQLLGEQAKELGSAARRKNVEKMQKLLDATRATCISCHTRFKDISGELPPQA